MHALVHFEKRSENVHYCHEFVNNNVLSLPKNGPKGAGFRDCLYKFLSMYGYNITPAIFNSTGPVNRQSGLAQACLGPLPLHS
jgi:hypothetical protein